MSGPSDRHVRVAIVGAGPVGLAAAIDLKLKGISAEVFDEDTGTCDGSRAIAWAKRTLEIFDRLGLGHKLRAEGVTWQLGKVFWDDKLVYQFDLLPEEGNANPAFVNMQQFRVEDLLIERLAEVRGNNVNWQHRLVAVENGTDGVRLIFETPEGSRTVSCDYLLACDGARSTVRSLMQLGFEGQVFQDKFLITDVRMKAEFPTERWFWFNPEFNRGQSALLHKQPDNVWRIDQQLGRDADPVEERKPERARSRISAMLGPDVEFEIVWISVYTFQCRRLQRFRHGRIVFAGDSAHQVSPFGGRGGNSGIQDADNLVWKLARVLDGSSPDALLDTYDDERIFATDENILNSTRATDFISPKSPVATAFRDAVLSLAETHSFARPFVNSGRLSRPAALLNSPLNSPDVDAFTAGVKPGTACPDAPIVLPNGDPGWLLQCFDGRFTALIFAGDEVWGKLSEWRHLLAKEVPELNCVVVAGTPGPTATIVDAKGLVASRYQGEPGTVYLVRPDQHVFARFRQFDPASIRRAVQRVIGGDHGAMPDRGRGHRSGMATISADG